MKKILYGLVGLVVLLVGAVIILPAFLPKDALKAQIETTASESLGRQVTLDGPIDISIFPTRAKVQGLTVANAEGFSRPYLMSVETAEVAVRLLPLLRQQVDITAFILDAPTIHLEQKADGTANWVLGTTPTEGSPAAGEDDAPQTVSGDVSLGDVRINNGVITFENGTETSYQATDANMTVTMTSLDAPLTIDGQMRLQDEPSSVELSLTTPRSYLETGAAEMALDMRVGENAAMMDLALSDGVIFQGDLEIDAPALRSLAALAGTEIETPNGFERLRLKGQVSGNETKLAFAEGTEVEFDDIRGTGQLTLDISGARPKATGAMDVGTMDLTPYVPAETGGMAEKRDNPEAEFPEWSTTPFDFSAFQTADADLSFSTEGIIMPGLEIGQSQAALKLENGAAQIILDRMALYGGTGSGTIGLNASGATPSLRVNLNLASVDAGRLAQDFAGLTKLTGTGDIAIDVRAAGPHEQAMVRSLNGTAKGTLADGAFTGVNLGRLARQTWSTFNDLQTGKVSAPRIAGSVTQLITAARGPAEQTDFTDFNLDAQIRDGIVTTSTINLAGPFYAMGGDARIDLPSQTASISLVPAVVPPASAEAADGAETELTDEATEPRLRKLPVPITIAGDFNSPKLGIDVQPVLTSLARGQLKSALGRTGLDIGEDQTIEDALRQEAQKGLQGLISGALGTKEANPASPTDEGGEAPAEAAPTPEGALSDQLIERGFNAILKRPQSQPSTQEEAPQE